MVNPVLSIHNIVVGTMYADCGGTMKISLLPWDDSKPYDEKQVPLTATVKFTKKGWFSKEEYKLEGEVQRHV